MNWLKATYRTIIDHLTKALGAVGTGIAAILALDPNQIREAAQQYLGAKGLHVAYGFLFALVILRGWYTGIKAKQ